MVFTSYSQLYPMQSQCITHYRNRAEAHCRYGNHRAEQQDEQRIKHFGRSWTTQRAASKRDLALLNLLGEG